MRMLALAAVVIAGCATTPAITPGPDPRAAHFEQESQKIDERERRCINETVTRSNRQITQIAAASGAFTDLQMQRLADERDRVLFECKASADRERDELSARERTEYQAHAQEERDRTSLMMILNTSRPH